MKKIILIGFLISCLVIASFLVWSFYKIYSREKYTGQKLATEGKFIKVGNVDTHYIRKGQGKSLILIHGMFSSSFVWHKNTGELSKYFDVISVDLRGYGYSDKPADGKYSRKHIRQFMVDFMNSIQVDKAILVGHSWGGGIAMDLALTCPHRVEKLVLINSSGYPLKTSPLEWVLKIPGVGKFLLGFADKETFSRILKEKIFFNTELVNEREIEGWIRPYYVRGAARAASELRKYNFDMTESIGDIPQTTLIIWGKEDKVLPVEMSERFKRDIKNCIMEIIPNCGHVPQEEKPAEINRIIKEFVCGN